MNCIFYVQGKFDQLIKIQQIITHLINQFQSSNTLNHSANESIISYMGTHRTGTSI